MRQLRVAHASRVLATAFRGRELFGMFERVLREVRFGKVRCGETPQPARETHALPGWIAPAFALLLVCACTAGAGVKVTAFEMTVADLPRAVAFYTGVLQFQFVRQEQREGYVAAQLRLGEETLILRDYAKNGRSIPNDLKANDRSFEHLAIVVVDLEAAYARLLTRHTRIESAGAQRLPDWNFDAAGIRAVYFRDPDGHFLELICFPNDKGEPRWHERDGPLFRGIDHSAIVVSDIKRSVAFYRDQIGLTLIGNSFNYGGEQELLSGVPGARVRIASFRGAKGPGVELLQYEAPGLTTTLSREAAPNDDAHWQIDLEAGARPAETLHDPDGHALALSPRPAGASLGEFAWDAWRRHWPRYFMEGAELGIFMIVALGLALMLEYPKSHVHRAIASPLLRRFIFGLGIGITVVFLIYCTWGRQSGAQFNPAVTLAMLYLHRIIPWDAFFYIVAQFIGGWLGVILMAAPFSKASANQKVNYVVTEPGKPGVAVAFVAEFVISFVLLATLRLVYQSDWLKPQLGFFAGFLLMIYITFESPYSGMSLNPARSVASAIPARSWKAIWIYFVATISAMLLAVVLFH